MFNQEDILTGRLYISGMQGPPGPPGPPGPGGDGVNTWNTRKGDVLPEVGDYNLNMVGAEMLTNTELDYLWEIN